jgi:serine/threonine-protein kinase RsbW
MSKNMTTIILQTPGEMHYLHRIRDFITGIAEESGIDERDLDNIELAVDEACANIIEHGYEPDELDKNLTIRMEINSKKLVLTISDQGKHFDPRKKKQAELKELIAMKRDGGLGISLIKQTMDEIDYRATPEGRNELILTKYLHK